MNWDCPYCSRPQTVVGTRHAMWKLPLTTQFSSDGYYGIEAEAIVCANHECRKTTVYVSLLDYQIYTSGDYRPSGKVVLSRSLQPEGSFKPLPDYIPSAIRDDYYEACLIRDLSPKASATLSRRCLQGMIRDFSGIADKTLYKEIDLLEKAVASGEAPRAISTESVAALHHVRKVGNIGAHMEADVAHIIDVEPSEAQALIDLIEMLLVDWYVERHKRAARFGTVKMIAENKDAQKALGPPVLDVPPA